MNKLEVWIKIQNTEILETVFSKLRERFGTWKNVARFLECSENAIYDYRKGSAIPENVFELIKEQLPENLEYKILKVKNRRSLGTIRRNEIHGFNLTTEKIAKGVENQPLTTRELQLLQQNKTLRLKYGYKVHHTVFKNGQFANFDIVYLNNNQPILVEDIEGSFSRNVKLNWFKLWRFIIKQQIINKLMVVTFWPNYAFNPVMKLILLENGILPLEISERPKILHNCFEDFGVLIKEKIKSCRNKLEQSIKFTNAGAKSELNKPYNNGEKLMHEYLCSKFQALGKQLVIDEFGGFHVVDDFAKIDRKEFLVEFFNSSSIIGILRRAIGFCFMVETIFKKDYGKIILYKSTDERSPDRFKLGKILKDKAIVISL